MKHSGQDSTREFSRFHTKYEILELIVCSVKLPKSFLAVNVSDSHASDSGRGSSDDASVADKASADNGMN